jgi:hypothetical protein
MRDNGTMVTRGLLALSLLLASSAHAEEPACWALNTIDVVTHDPGSWTVTGPTWTLASGLGSLTLGDSRQAATMERGTERQVRVAWSRPPQGWCTGDPVELSATVEGNFGGFVYASDPVDAMALAAPPTPPVPFAGVNALDATVITGGLAKSLSGSISAAPREGCETDWSVTARADLGNGQWIGVRYHYSRRPPGDGSGSTAPTGPPVAAEEVGSGGSDPNLDSHGGEGDDEDEDDEDDEDDEPGGDEPEESEPGYLQDSTNGWFHLGGGFGILPATAYPGGLFVLGVGFYTFGLYVGGGFEATFSEFGIRPHGQGYVGVHLPFPVFHPMFGIRLSGGASLRPDPSGQGVASETLSMTAGGQAGFILRKFGGGPGLRVMVEPVYALDQSSGLGRFEVWVSFAGVI